MLRFMLPIELARTRFGDAVGVILRVWPLVSAWNDPSPVAVPGVVVKLVTVCTTCPGLLTPGPINCNVVQADAQDPAVASPDAKSQ